MYSTVEVPYIDRVGHASFGIVFLNDLSVKNTSQFNYYKKKIVSEFDISKHVTQDLQEIRTYFNISALRI